MDARTVLQMAAKGLRRPDVTYRYLRKNGRLGRIAACQASSRGWLGTHVFEKEWDLLILLDSCRLDALRLVADEYSFLGDIGRLRSVGGSSPEWIAATFDRSRAAELRETAYLSNNAYVEFVLGSMGAGEEFSGHVPGPYFFWADWDPVRPDAVGRIEQIWQHEVPPESQFDYLSGYVPSRYVTDRAIAVGRDFDFDRQIVHYARPHLPYTTNALAEDREPYVHERKPMAYLRATGDRTTVFNTYLDHLRSVLDEVEVLLENIDAETVAISADHGEAFGQWGTYAHVSGSLHPHVRNVPWAVTSGADSGEFTPGASVAAHVGPARVTSGADSGEFTPELDPNTAAERSAEETLEALGYVDE